MIFIFIFTDATAPSISCPGNIHVYTKLGKAEVKWPPATALDNVGTVGPPTLDKPTTSSFDIGLHSVVYVSKDKAGNEARCISYVQVERLGKCVCILSGI